ncbi:MAG: hypothetical protein S4CHLAM37_03260 [Chlamydiia bacterium]|nr:hypothetical protein [Chlamydiia bacterium]
MSKKLSLSHALMWIIGSTILITGGTYSLLKNSANARKELSFDHAHVIRKIIQTGPHRDHLKTSILAEVLDLSCDDPRLTKRFNVKDAEKKLLKNLPMVKSAKLHIVKPDILYIDYMMRVPMAMLYDFENTAIDEEGYLFPFSPFYSPKSIPEIYLGMQAEEASFDKPLKEEALLLATRVLKSLRKIALHQNFYIKRIDVSHAFERSLGKREIVLQLYSKNHTLYLSPKSSFLYSVRLDPSNYAKNLGDYLMLHKELVALEKLYDYKVKEDERVIDMRLDNTAYIEEIASN